MSQWHSCYKTLKVYLFLYSVTYSTSLKDLPNIFPTLDFQWCRLWLTFLLQHSGSQIFWSWEPFPLKNYKDLKESCLCGFYTSIFTVIEIKTEKHWKTHTHTHACTHTLYLTIRAKFSSHVRKSLEKLHAYLWENVNERKWTDLLSIPRKIGLTRGSPERVSGPTRGIWTTFLDLPP